MYDILLYDTHLNPSKLLGYYDRFAILHYYGAELVVYNAQNGDTISTTKVGKGWDGFHFDAASCEWNPSGGQIIVARPGSLPVYDVDGDWLYSFKNLDGGGLFAVTDVAWSDTLLVGIDNGYVGQGYANIWTEETRNEKSKYLRKSLKYTTQCIVADPSNPTVFYVGNEPGEVRDLTISPDGSSFLLSDPLTTHGAPVRALAVMGRAICSQSIDGEVRITPIGGGFSKEGRFFVNP